MGAATSWVISGPAGSPGFSKNGVRSVPEAGTDGTTTAAEFAAYTRSP